MEDTCVAMCISVIHKSKLNEDIGVVIKTRFVVCGGKRSKRVIGTCQL